MATVSDYQVLQNQRFTLGVNQDRTLSFTLPSNFVAGTDLARPLMAFTADPTNDANNLRVEVEINDQQIYSIILTGTVMRTIFEPFGGTVLNQNGSNTVQFRVESGAGQVAFENVILWYQVDI